MRWIYTRPRWWPWHLLAESCRVPEPSPAPLAPAAMPSPAAVAERPARTIRAWRDYEISAGEPRAATGR